MENENINKFFYQIKQYYKSNFNLLKYLNGENKEEIKKDWSEDLFRAISRNWIKEWKLYIGYDNIYQELKNKNVNEIKDDDKDWITSLIKKNT